MFCRKCGTKIKEGAKFCQSCGEPVAQQQKMNEEKPVAQAVKKTNNLSITEDKKKKLITVAAGVVVCLVVIFIVSNFGKNKFNGTWISDLGYGSYSELKIDMKDKTAIETIIYEDGDASDEIIRKAKIDKDKNVTIVGDYKTYECIYNKEKKCLLTLHKEYYKKGTKEAKEIMNN